MIEEHPDEVGAVPASGLRQEDLLTRVMRPGVFEEPVIEDGPAGERPRGLFDIALGIGADPEGEELHQLAGEVLVGVPLAIGRGVEPDHEGRVAHRGVQEVGERGSSVSAKEIVLPAHGGQVRDFLVAGGKVIVPHQGEPFAQRVGAHQHPEDPPRLEAVGVARSDRRPGDRRRRPLELGGEPGGENPALQEPVDARLVAVCQVAPELLAGRGEPRPAVQVDDAAEVPGRFGRRPVRGPVAPREAVVGMTHGPRSGRQLNPPP